MHIHVWLQGQTVPDGVNVILYPYDHQQYITIDPISYIHIYTFLTIRGIVL